MPNSLDKASQRVHIWLYEDDVRRVDAWYCTKGVKRSYAIRELLHKILNQIEAKRERDTPSRHIGVTSTDADIIERALGGDEPPG